MAAQAIGSDNGIPRGDAFITFPYGFDVAAHTIGLGSAYAPSGMGRPELMPEGNDLQAQWHEQKKADARAMANAKVDATRVARHRSFTSHNGYFDHPSPVLGQRIFANPSFGGVAGYESARRDYSTAPFHWADAEVGSGVSGGLVGGVLRSAEGQAYAKRVLAARLKDFDAIAEAKQSFVTSGPGTTFAPNTAMSAVGDIPETVGESVRIELNNLLQAIADGLAEGQGGAGLKLNRFSNADAQRALSIIFRVSPSADASYLGQLVGQVESIVHYLDEIVAVPPDEEDQVTVATAVTLLTLFKKVDEYLTKMLDSVDKSPKDRLSLSKSLVISLGFAKPNTDMPVAAAQEREDIRSNSSFSRRAPTREDTEHGTTEADDDEDDDEDGELPLHTEDFDEDERQTFGYRSGDYYRQQGRDTAAFYGEEGNLEREREQLGRRQRRGPPPPSSVVSSRAPSTPRRIAEAHRGISAARYDPDTQSFNVGSVVSRVPSTTSSERQAFNQAQAEAAAPAMPTTYAELRQYATMERLRALASQMTTAGTPYRIRPTTNNVAHVQKVIAKKLGIRR